MWALLPLNHVYPNFNPRIIMNNLWGKKPISMKSKFSKCVAINSHLNPLWIKAAEGYQFWQQKKYLLSAMFYRYIDDCGETQCC